MVARAKGSTGLAQSQDFGSRDSVADGDGREAAAALWPDKEVITMKLSHAATSLFCVALLGALPARAEKHTMSHEEAGLQFDVPDGWKAEDPGEGENKDGTAVMASPEDGTVVFILWVVQADSVQQAMDGLTGELDKMLKDVKMESEKPEEGQIDGMQVFHFTGTGTSDGKPMSFNVAVIAAKKPVIALTMGEEPAGQKHLPELQDMIASIRKL
jgi:predicted Zn-dependent protease